jgi:uncharacterized membrane protein
MVSEEHAASKSPVSAVLAGPYGHPFHPILVTVPIGAWVASLVFDIASRFADKPGFLTQGSEWLIALGVLGAVAAASIGFLDFFSLPPRTAAYRTAQEHMVLNLGVTAAYAVAFFWRHASPADGHRVAIAPLVLSAVCLCVLALSGFLGGKLAYHYGVRVADETTQADGFAAGARVPRQQH